jgi:hypothetical protein
LGAAKIRRKLHRKKSPKPTIFVSISLIVGWVGGRKNSSEIAPEKMQKTHHFCLDFCSGGPKKPGFFTEIESGNEVFWMKNPVSA